MTKTIPSRDGPRSFLFNERPSPFQLFRKFLCTKILKYFLFSIDALCASLVVIDVLGNNWEINHFVGDAKHFFTPLLPINDINTLNEMYTFPEKTSPAMVSLVGEFMIEKQIDQIHNKDNSYYRLTMGSHLITSKSKNLCLHLIQNYSTINHIKNNHIRFGWVEDHITFIRGNTVLNLFSDKSIILPPINATGNDLIQLGYIPSRVGLDLRLTSSIILPLKSGLIYKQNISNYQFFSKSFCSGCQPGTELGMDTCEIEYIYNDTTKVISILKSSMNHRQYHSLGFIFPRRPTALISVIIRGSCVIVSLIIFSRIQKTVRWTDPLSIDTTYKRCMHMIAPTAYRHPNYSFSFFIFLF